MNNLLKFGIVSGISIIIYYCCKRPDKKSKVKFNDKPEIIKITEPLIINPKIIPEITEPIIPIIPITYNILDHYKISNNINLRNIDLKNEPQIIDYYKIKSPVKSKDDKWEIIS
tara:strand:+ start:573 stop:914 length:342 start_codon:yes stop_codon:yes gene_type:complete